MIAYSELTNYSDKLEQFKEKEHPQSHIARCITPLNDPRTAALKPEERTDSILSPCVVEWDIDINPNLTML